MGFNVGERYECVADGRKAVVAQVRSAGRDGLLRFIDTATEAWVLWADVQAGKWRKA
jgi:hypothetical protein